MFHQGAPVQGLSADGMSAQVFCTCGLSTSRVFSFSAAVVIVGILLLASPAKILGQRGGGGGGGGGGIGSGGGRNSTPIICVHDCAGPRAGLSSQDDLKDFNRAMAVQATAEQRAAFAKIALYVQSARDQLQAFRESLQPVPGSSTLQQALPLTDRATAVGDAIEKARASNQNFLTSFSTIQKSSLKDIANKLAKADSELDKQKKTLDQIVQTMKPDNEQMVSSVAALDKAIASFQTEQFALGEEMSILFPAAGQGVTFSLPAVTNSIKVAGQPIAISSSGAVSRTSSGNGHDVFSLRLVADLSDLQQNITAILRSELNRAPGCGERIEVSETTLLPMAPASLVVVHLHFERWICPGGSGRQSPTELAAGDGEIEIKLTPSVDQNSGLALTSEISRVEADGSLRGLLRTGDLGVTLREQITAAVLSALKEATDLKATLPPGARESATIQKAQFDDAGTDQLSLVLEGQLQFSEEQTKQFAAQIKQRLSAQGASPP